MAVSLTLPELGESVTEGIVTRWLKNVGDAVTQDEPLVEIATDKVDTEIPSPVSGVISEIVANVDDSVEVGGVLCTITEPGDDPVTTPQEAPPSEPTAHDEVPRDKEPEAETPGPAAVESPSSTTGSASIMRDFSPLSLVEVTLPELGESVQEGTVTRWCRQLGEFVGEDEPLVEVSTDKVDTEIPSPASGIVVQLCVQEEETVPVGTVLAVLQVVSAADPIPPVDAPEESGEDSSPSDTSDTPPTEEAIDTAAEDNTTDDAVLLPPKVPQGTPSFDDFPGTQSLRAAADRASTDHSYVTPLVRKVAEDHDIALDNVVGSGIGGRILKKDVLAAAQQRDEAAAAAAAAHRAAQDKLSTSPEAASLKGTVKPASLVLQSTASSALAAVRNTAQLSQVFEIDFTNLLRQLVVQDIEEASLPASLRACVAFVVARALCNHPQLNASYDHSSQLITYHDNVNLSLGIDTPQGLVSPVIRSAEQATIAVLAGHIQALENSSLNGTLSPSDLTGGTFTLTHPGASRMLWETPLVIPPQSAALSFSNPVQRPIAVDDAGGNAVAIRAMSYFTLSYDSCLIDGPAASRFLGDVQEILEDASFLDDLDDPDIFSQ